MVDFRQLAKAGVHFGHQTARWNPKMAAYIWGHRNGIHLVDVSKTARQLEKAMNFIEKITSEGKQVLFVGTKKAAQPFIEEAGQALRMPFVARRWIGGTLTNNSQVKKSVTRLLHYQDILDKSQQQSLTGYSKKELGVIGKMVDRLGHNVGGIRNLRWPVGAVVIIDVRKEQTALKEAMVMGVPVIGLVDTNSDPSSVDYVIPGNDDSPKAIKIIVEHLAQAVQKGAAVAQQLKEAKEMSAEEGLVEESKLDLEGEEEEKPKPRARAPRPAQSPKKQAASLV